RHDSNCDWGLVENLRLEMHNRDQHCKVIAPQWARHLLGPVYRKLSNGGSHSVTITPGGTVTVTSLEPTALSASVKLSDIRQANLVLVRSTVVEEPPISLAEYTCGGIRRQALFSHPPDQGVRMLHFFVQPSPGADVSLRTAVGLAHGSKSGGVRFAIWLNGNELWSKRVVPADGWVPVSVSLGKVTGDPVLLTLVTDSDGHNYYDWAVWADPELTVQTP
ncbi:MAG: NPCBM/NEW2 domain-containing protein, partial [Armatimonadota bacterium]